MRFATDTGGTFTDLIIEDDDGRISMFKAATVPSAPVKGVLAAFDIAAAQLNVDRRTLLGRGSAFIHGTTHAINAIVTRRTAKTALLVTEGHPDILVLREGGRLEPFNHQVPYPEPYISRSLTFEIPERVLASGEVRHPLDEAAVIAIADRLRELQVEAIGVCLLWSVLHPSHERRVSEILRERLPHVPITLSHQLNPSLREYRRAIATAIDASLKPLMGRYFAGLTESMREAGFTGRILVLTSQGGMVERLCVGLANLLRGHSRRVHAGTARLSLACRRPRACRRGGGGAACDGRRGNRRLDHHAVDQRRGLDRSAVVAFCLQDRLRKLEQHDGGPKLVGWLAVVCRRLDCFGMGRGDHRRGADLYVIRAWIAVAGSAGRRGCRPRGGHRRVVGAPARIHHQRLLLRHWGILFGHFLGTLAVNIFWLNMTFLTLAMLVVGGLRSLTGAVVGTLVVAAIRGFLRALEQGANVGGVNVQVPQGMQEITLAVVLLLILVYRPQGIVGDRELGLAAAK